MDTWCKSLFWLQGSSLTYNPEPSPKRLLVSTTNSGSSVTSSAVTSATTSSSLTYNPTPAPRRPLSSAEQAKQDFLARTVTSGTTGTQSPGGGPTMTNNLNKPYSSLTSTVTTTTSANINNTPTTVYTQRTSSTSVSSASPTGGRGDGSVEQYNALGGRPPSAPSGEYMRIQREQQQVQRVTPAPASGPRSPTEINHAPPVNGTAEKLPTEVRLLSWTNGDRSGTIAWPCHWCVAG